MSSIYIFGYSEFFNLEARGGKIIDPKGDAHIAGAFALRFFDGANEFISKNVSLPPNEFFVKKEGHKWLLFRVKNKPINEPEFYFDTKKLKFQGNSEGPWCQSGGLKLHISKEELPILSIISPQFSINPFSKFIQGERDILHTAVGKIDVEGTFDSSVSARGFFLRTKGNKLITSGTISDAIALDDINKNLSINAQESTPFFFSITPDKTNADTNFRLNEIRVSINDLGFQTEDFISFGVTRYTVQAQHLVASKGWLKLERLSGKTTGVKGDTNLALEAGKAKKSALGDKFRLFAPFKDISFNYPLPSSTDGKIPKNHHPQFVYRNSAFDGAKFTVDKTNWRTAYYGIQVKDLQNPHSGGQTMLDTNLAIFEFNPTSKKFDLKSGSSLSVRGKSEDSLLVPKPLDPFNEEGTRELSFSIDRFQLKGQYSSPDLDVKKSPLRLDTSNRTGVFIMNSAYLEAEPIGVPSYKSVEMRSLNGSEPIQLAYSNWQLKRDSQSFKFVGGKLEPLEPDWTVNYRSDTTVHKLLTQPGKSFKHNDAMALDAAPLRTIIDKKNLGGAKPPELVYKQLNATVLYDWFSNTKPNLEGIQFQVKDLLDQTVQRFIESNKPDALKIRYAKGEKDFEFFKAFIDSQIPESESTLIQITGQYGILLKQGKGADAKYCFQFNEHATIIADLTPNERIDLRTIENLKLKTYKQLKDEDPELWPSKFGAGKLDPSIPEWRGLFMVNMPFNITPDLELLKKIEEWDLKPLKELIELINENTQIKYGWLDENGATLNAEYTSKDSGGNGDSIIPESFRNILDLRVLQGGIKIRENESPVGVTIKMKAIIPLIKNAGKSLVLNGEGVFSAITKPYFRLYPEEEITALNPFPGFKKFELVQLDTDFGNVNLDFKAWPTEALAKVIPYFNEGEAVRGRFSLNLKSSSTQASISFFLDQETETTFGGLFPMSIKGIMLKYEKITNKGYDVSLFAKLSFNLLGHKLGGLATFSKNTFQLKLDSFSMKLNFGEAFSLTGSLEWSDGKLNPFNELTIDDQFADKINESVFFGSLTMKSDLLDGKLDGKFIFKYGAQNNIPFLLGAYAYSKDTGINLGVAKLEKPFFLIAKNADWNGQLEQLALSPGKSIFQALRTGTTESEVKAWLNKWNANSTIGSSFAASGYINLGVKVISDEIPSGDTTGKNLTSLYFTTNGVLRVDAVVKLFGKSVGVAVAIDTRRKRMALGLNLPAFNFPPVGQPQLEVNPGPIHLQWSYGGYKYFKVNAAFPDFNPGQNLERDWSNAFRVKVSAFKPPLPNTAWGGFKFELDDNSALFAYAIKAGYTKSGSFLVLKYSLEVSVGAVAMLKIADINKPSKNDQQFLSVSEKPNTPKYLGNDNKEPLHDAAFIDEVISGIELLLSTESRDLESLKAGLAMSYESFGLIDGSANAELFGVTLVGARLHVFAGMRMCGDTDGGITYMGGRFNFSLSVKIGCFTYSRSFSLPVELIKGNCAVDKNVKLLSYA